MTRELKVGDRVVICNRKTFAASCEGIYKMKVGTVLGFSRSQVIVKPDSPRLFENYFFDREELAVSKCRAHMDEKGVVL